MGSESPSYLHCDLPGSVGFQDMLTESQSLVWCSIALQCSGSGCSCCCTSDMCPKYHLCVCE